ncbi:hypothetical protein [Nocardia sp. NRRL S-836]|uniref:hypothetical protein n=1 Tax=Nocardia sp. NRRL S-836 TaxID=1519492 RepID=UPI0006AFA85E|nr:hypothetical protein [Nocardia sp. NRRL S-836]KOV85752.1 hypothetical protein ADL03_10850 [Nocardia sp. NRRL S-836]
MPHETPRFPQPNANYSAHSHADMHRQAMQGNDPGAAGEIAAEWKSIGAELTDVAVGINTVINGMRAGWTGAAGAGASRALTKVGTFTDELASTFAVTGGVVERQAEAAEAAKNKFPKEVPFEPARMLKDAASSLNPFRVAAAPFEILAQHEKSKAAKQEAERVMQERDTALATAGASMPAFEDVPQVTNGQQGITTTSSSTFTRTTGSVDPAPHLGNPGTGDPRVSSLSAATPNTPGVGSPATGNTGTTNTAWAAPVTSETPAPVPVSGTPGDRAPLVPGSGLMTPGSPTGANIPRTAAGTGRGGAAGAGGAGRGGVGGGRGPGQGSPGAVGRGASGFSGPGGGAGAGHGPEGAARGGAAGRSGAPGAAGAGTGAGNGGEEDKEHRSNYLVPTDEYFDDDRMVAPPVIGD